MDKILQSLRLMAWERAKGELKSIGQAYYPDGQHWESDKDISEFQRLVDEFIKQVEDQGLIEGT